RVFYAAPARAFEAPDRLFEPPATATARASVIAGRRALLRALPGAYLTHRWRQFRRVLGLSNVQLPAVYTSYTETVGQAVATRHRARHSAVQQLLVDGMHALEATVVFDPYLYVALACALLVLSVIRRDRLCVALLASGLIYELTWFVVAARAEYRLSLWLITCTLLATACLLSRWLTSREARRQQRA
ncbi:MAG: hypothetical protein H0X17_01430, partial [Deltaproteobacteria bacterium]|nr:hypothetical protein [Deltaproteobacteria bacterium]